jgi:diguanylate cyclase (GGDEF)-like protein
VSEQRIAAARQQLETLKRDYCERTRGLLQTLAERLQQQQDLALLDELEGQLHKLAGSGGSFGFAELSRQARRLETRLRRQRTEIAESDLVPLAAELRGLLPLLDDRAGRAAVDASAPPTETPGAVLVWTASAGEDSQRLISTLEQFGHRVQHLQQRAAFAAALERGAAPALLVDLEAEGHSDAAREGLLEWLAERRAEGRLGPGFLFALSAADTLPLRLKAARIGATGFFVRPFDPVKLVDRLERLREQRLELHGKILLVDDDQLLARHHAAVLEAGGFETWICTDPMRALEDMERFQPDLVLMDLYMPGCSGPELARVIRMQDAWLATPLVFLSAETDLDLQFTAASEGADDFLTKPIADGHLLAAVRARIERARQVAQLINADSLTGLLKHGRIKEELVHELARAGRQGQSLGLVMIDIDHFKRVNDRFGHPVGDEVLRALGHLLRQRARKSDRVGRYGGEEFMLILTDCGCDNARRIAEDIRQRFSALDFTAKGEAFKVTLSAGIACFPQCGEASELLARADAALYAAKQQGRNRVELAG